MPGAICIYEDRIEEEVGIRILISSLRRYNPNLEIFAFLPNATDDLSNWLKDIPLVRRFTLTEGSPSGWNIKPDLLQKALEFADAAVWIDSDIMVTAPIPDQFFDPTAPRIIVAEEALWARDRNDGGRRAKAWDLEPERLLESGVNSCVVAVNRSHLPLLERWKELLGDTRYVTAQKGNYLDRPFHLFGDQDLLTVVLSTAPFHKTPLEMLRIGKGITQCFGLFGFTPGERVRWLRRGPTLFIHSQGPKPWRRQNTAKATLVQSLDLIYRDTSPYTLIARSYSSDLSGSDWTKPRTRLGGLSRLAGFGSIALSGFPIALVGEAWRLWKLVRDRAPR